jgi:DNA-binding transcriptional LysR family regulator
MDTFFLQSFVAVVDHGSMAEAARRLNLTPAAVAQRIRALEAEIGCLLIMRVGRVTCPTEGGTAILEQARQILREVRNLSAAANNSVVAGELRIGAVATALTGLIPGVMAEMIARHPHVEIYLEPGTSVDLYRLVFAGELDAAVVTVPPFAIPKTCTVTVIREEPLVVVAPQSFSGQDPHTLLRTQPFIRYDRQHWGGRLADQYLLEAGIAPSERFELDALDAIAVMVDKGLGVSLVPDWAPPWPHGLALAKIPLPEPAPKRLIGVVRMIASPRTPGVNAFLNACRTCIDVNGVQS